MSFRDDPFISIYPDNDTEKYLGFRFRFGFGVYTETETVDRDRNR
jgi:hypothetical protein